MFVKNDSKLHFCPNSCVINALHTICMINTLMISRRFFEFFNVNDPISHGMFSTQYTDFSIYQNNNCFSSVIIVPSVFARYILLNKEARRYAAPTTTILERAVVIILAANRKADLCRCS